VSANTTAEEILTYSPDMVSEYTAERIQQYIEAGHANNYYEDTDKVAEHLFQYVVDANVEASIQLTKSKPKKRKSKKAK
jgi:hypothetical protein